MVEKGAPGLSIGKKEHKMGIRASSTCEVILEDCEVPAENLLGSEGDGFHILMKTLDFTRPCVAAQALGIAQGALDFATAYAKERVQFGKAIIKNQGLNWMLADMDTQVEAARQMVYKTCAVFEAGAQGPEPGAGGGHAPVGHGQAVRRRDGHEGDHRRGADPGRLRLHPGVPGGAHDARRQDHPNLRGHLAGAKDGHRRVVVAAKPWPGLQGSLRQLPPRRIDIYACVVNWLQQTPFDRGPELGSATG